MMLKLCSFAFRPNEVKTPKDPPCNVALIPRLVSEKR